MRSLSLMTVAQAMLMAPVLADYGVEITTAEPVDERQQPAPSAEPKGEGAKRAAARLAAKREANNLTPETSTVTRQQRRAAARKHGAAQ